MKRAAIAVVTGCLLAALFLPFACRLPNFLIADDGYFYAEIAYRIATEGRSTFDGVHTTSGYHLPWGFVLAGASQIVALFTRDHVVHLYAHIAVALSIAVATARHFFKSWLFQLCAFVLILSNFSLTEMVLAAPIMLGILRGGRHRLWLAVLLPVVRIDLLGVPLVVAAFSFRRDRRAALELAGATLGGAVVQLISMKLGFGHFFSVSALLKATSGPSALLWRARFNLTQSSFQTLFFAAHFALAGLALFMRRDRTTWMLVVASFAFLLPHTLLSILRGWYWVPSSVAILFALEQALIAPELRRARVAKLSVAVVIIAWVVHSLRVQLVYAADARGSTEFVADVQRLVPAHERIFTLDSPGFLGFFTGRDVIDGDGLVNDYDYASRYERRELATYLEEEDVCYVVIDYPDQAPDPTRCDRSRAIRGRADGARARHRAPSGKLRAPQAAERALRAVAVRLHGPAREGLRRHVAGVLLGRHHRTARELLLRNRARRLVVTERRRALVLRSRSCVTVRGGVGRQGCAVVAHRGRRDAGLAALLGRLTRRFFDEGGRARVRTRTSRQHQCPENAERDSHISPNGRVRPEFSGRGR